MGPECAITQDVIFQHAPTWSEQVLCRENWVIASCCERSHVYPRREPTSARWGKLCNGDVRAPIGQWAGTHRERKQRRTWLGRWVHVRGDDRSATEAVYFLGNNNSPLVLLTQLTINTACRNVKTVQNIRHWRVLVEVVLILEPNRTNDIKPFTTSHSC